MNEKMMLMNAIKKYDFALYELNLYLDTHPRCQSALAHFGKYRDLRNKAIDEYTRKYGPLTADKTNIEEGWKWAEGPWPWQKEGN